MGFRFGMAGGMACAVPAPPSARGVRTGPHGRDALLRVRGTCARGLGFASGRLTWSARRPPARGKRKSPKRFCLEVPQFFGHKNSHAPVNKGGSGDLRFAASENPTAGARRRSRGRGREGGSGVRRHPVFKPKNSKSGAAASFPASAGSNPRHLPPRPFRTSLAPSAMA